MDFLVEPKNGSWVAGNLSKETLKQRLTTADINISDLDGTDARSSAKYIALRAIGTSYVDPGYHNWVRETALEWVKAKLNGNQDFVGIEQWKKYVDSFLQDEMVLQEIRKLFTPAKVGDLLYRGVAELYTIIKADKYYCTHNIEPVASAFAGYLDFMGSYTEIDDKEKFMECFVEDNPHFQRYLLKGNSPDEEAMYDVLKSAKRRGKIEEATFIYCATKPTAMSNSADVNTSKNQWELFNLVTERILRRVM